jgi:NADH dehydrogenase [ubiquinone] 1 alpha subcomplex assembly factor 5
MPSPSGESLRVFDRRAVRLHRERAARAPGAADFLVVETAERLVDRLDDITRRFPTALDLGCRDGILARRLAGRGGIETLVHADSALAFARTAPAPRLVCEAEALPFKAHAFDLVLSNLDLHWANDLPGALLQLRQTLKPDGLLLASLLGGATLAELRDALIAAELAEEGGAGPRVSPFADLRDAAGLLQRAGFALPVADVETLTVTYPDALALMRDLRGMGETNATLARSKRFAGRDMFARAAALYAEHHGDAEGRIAARFRLLFLTGWAPHESQQRPQSPGSAKRRLADALETAERPAGDKAKPGRR